MKDLTFTTWWVQELPEIQQSDSKEITQWISLLQKTLLHGNPCLSDLDTLEQLLNEQVDNNPMNRGIRIPLEDIWDPNMIKEQLSNMKASHTLWLDGNQEVIIISRELVSKLRTKIIAITKSKVHALLNDGGISSDTVHGCVTHMKEALSRLWVTRKELINMWS